MLPRKRTRKIQRIWFFAAFQRQKSSPKSIGLLHPDWDFQSLNRQQFFPPKPDFHIQNRLQIPLSEPHFQTSNFLVEHINHLGDSLSDANPAPRVGLSATIFLSCHVSLQNDVWSKDKKDIRYHPYRGIRHKINDSTKKSLLSNKITIQLSGRSSRALILSISICY